MNLRSKYLLAILFLLVGILSLGCSGQIPKDGSLEISMVSSSPKTLRGLQQVHISPDRQVSVYLNGIAKSGVVPEWQYRKLVSSLRRLNFNYWLKETLGLLDDKDSTFVLSVKSHSTSNHFVWEGDDNSVFQQVLNEFRSISRGVTRSANNNARNSKNPAIARTM